MSDQELEVEIETAATTRLVVMAFFAYFAMASEPTQLDRSSIRYAAFQAWLLARGHSAVQRLRLEEEAELIYSGAKFVVNILTALSIWWYIDAPERETIYPLTVMGLVLGSLVLTRIGLRRPEATLVPYYLFLLRELLYTLASIVVTILIGIQAGQATTDGRQAALGDFWVAFALWCPRLAFSLFDASLGVPYALDQIRRPVAST